MGRIILEDIDFTTPLKWGVFSGAVHKIDEEENTVVLKDIFTRELINIQFEISDELDYTSARKPIWLNQIGEIGIGEENNLFDSFKLFRKVESWNTPDGRYAKGAKPADITNVGSKRYWRARKGETHLFNFLRAYHNLDPNSKATDYSKKQTNYNLKKLLLSDNDHEPIVSGCLYISERYEQKVLNKYIPGCYASVLKNLNGDFSQFLHKDSALKEFVNLFINNLNPAGYYSWNNINEWDVKLYKTKNSEF